MARTFQDSLAHDGQHVFLSADEFAEEIVHIPPGSDPVTIRGSVDYDGDVGNPVNDERGTRVIERAILELPASVQVTPELPGGRYGSVFTIAGQVWIAKRIVGRDAGTQSFEIQRVDEKSRKRIGL